MTRCEYCIEHHARFAWRLGASWGQLLGAAYITAAVESLLGGAIEIGEALTLYPQPSALSGLPIEEARNIFVNTVLQENSLPLPLRYVLAAAAAMAKECEQR